jgi:hypothetical protein
MSLFSCRSVALKLVLPRWVHVVMLNSKRALMELGMEIRLVGKANEVIGAII